MPFRTRTKWTKPTKRTRPKWTDTRPKPPCQHQAHQSLCDLRIARRQGDPLRANTTAVSSHRHSESAPRGEQGTSPPPQEELGPGTTCRGALRATVVHPSVARFALPWRRHQTIGDTFGLPPRFSATRFHFFHFPPTAGRAQVYFARCRDDSGGTGFLPDGGTSPHCPLVPRRA